MNKKTPSAMLLLSTTLCLLLLTGCQSSSATPTTTTTDTATNEELTALGNKLPDRRAEMNGTVKKIVGNIYTIEVVDMSAIFGSGTNQEDMRAQMQTMTDTERAAYFQKMQEARDNAPRYTKDVLVPAGIPITITTGRGGFGGGGGGAPGGPGGAGGRGPGGGFGGGGGRAPGGPGAAGGVAGTLANRTTPTNRPAPKMGTIADIKIDNTLTIWIQTGTDDRTIAEWVNVQQ